MFHAGTGLFRFFLHALAFHGDWPWGTTGRLQASYIPHFRAKNKTIGWEDALSIHHFVCFQILILVRSQRTTPRDTSQIDIPVLCWYTNLRLNPHSR